MEILNNERRGQDDPDSRGEEEIASPKERPLQEIVNRKTDQVLGKIVTL